MQITYQVLGEPLDGGGVCPVVNPVGDDFLGQEAGVVHVVQVPEYGAGVEAQGLGQVLDAHRVVGHGPEHPRPIGMYHEAQGGELPVTQQVRSFRGVLSRGDANAQVQAQVGHWVLEFARAAKWEEIA